MSPVFPVHIAVLRTEIRDINKAVPFLLAKLFDIRIPCRDRSVSGILLIYSFRTWNNTVNINLDIRDPCLDLIDVSLQIPSKYFRSLIIHRCIRIPPKLIDPKRKNQV